MSEENEVVSPEVEALRKELNIVSNIFFILGGATIKANEAAKAVELLDYQNALVVKAQDALNSRLATEALGKPVKMKGSVVSMEEHKASEQEAFDAIQTTRGA